MDLWRAGIHPPCESVVLILRNTTAKTRSPAPNIHQKILGGRETLNLSSRSHSTELVPASGGAFHRINVF